MKDNEKSYMIRVIASGTRGSIIKFKNGIPKLKRKSGVGKVALMAAPAETFKRISEKPKQILRRLKFNL